MRFCQEHWEELKAAVSRYGMDHLVAENGQQATAHQVRELTGENTLVDFEPLLGSHNVLVNTALHLFGLSVLNPDGPDEGHHCPVCMLSRCVWSEWVVQGARVEATRRGLLPELKLDPGKVFRTDPEPPAEGAG